MKKKDKNYLLVTDDMYLYLANYYDFGKQSVKLAEKFNIPGGSYCDIPVKQSCEFDSILYWLNFSNDEWHYFGVILKTISVRISMATDNKISAMFVTLSNQYILQNAKKTNNKKDLYKIMLKTNFIPDSELLGYKIK